MGVSDGGVAQQAPEDTNEFAGLGPILEDDDATVFKETDALIRRQELLALNHWNQDEFYKCVVDGYPWATLMHDQTRDVYTFELPYGVSSLSIQPVPNKNLDLVNKTSEQILVDFPEADAEPLDDSEEAENAADMANRFLAQDGGEQGTNDAVLYDDRVKLALSTATTYIEYWVDPSGGGYVPLQIEAHPQAESPDNPLVGPDGMPTADYVLRYVTAPQGGQFTNDPSQAAPQWQPKIRASKWERQHVRVFPEHLPVDQAEKTIILGHCTVGEAKRRWPSVAAMAPEDVSALCDWTPSRYLVLLPPFQRARWKLSDGKTLNKGGSSDERIMFYYHIYQRATPDYPKGADVVVSGIDGGLILDKKLLSVEVEVSKGQAQKVKETRCREIPVVQITPRGDPTGQDPTGRCYVSAFVGATEANAVLGQGFAEALDKILHTPFASSSLSPIEGADVEDARRSGRILTVIRPEDLPKQLDPPVLPTMMFQMMTWSDEAINSIANRERAASGDLEGAKERSGKAIQIAVSQNNIGNSSMLTAVNNSYARGGRIKLELMMSECTTTQQVGYVGEDGANKVMDLHAIDFALIGKVGIKAGTGTGLSQDGKVQYLANLKAEQFIPPEEAMDAARPSFAKRLGVPPNPFEQYVSRCVDAWLEGPPADDEEIDPMTGMPKPGWAQQYQAWSQAEQMQESMQAAAPAMPGHPPAAPQAPMAPLPPKPWTPFSPRPNDTEPAIAAIWLRRLSRVMSSTNYEKHGPEWADVLNRQYTMVRQAVALAAAAAQAQAAPGKPAQPGQPATPATKPTQPTQPNHAAPALPAGAHAT